MKGRESSKSGAKFFLRGPVLLARAEHGSPFCHPPLPAAPARPLGAGAPGGTPASRPGAAGGGPVRLRHRRHPGAARGRLALLDHAFDQAWGLHAGGPRYCARHGIDPNAGPVPLVAYLVVPGIHVVSSELAGVRLRRGAAIWSPQTSEPLQDWLARHSGPVTLHHEASELPQQARLRWRLYRHAVPERLRHMLDSTLPDVLRIRESDAAELSARQDRLRRRKAQLAKC